MRASVPYLAIQTSGRNGHSSGFLMLRTILRIQQPRLPCTREEAVLSLIQILIAQLRVMLSNQTVILCWSEHLRVLMRGGLLTAQKKSTICQMAPFHFRAKYF